MNKLFYSIASLLVLSALPAAARQAGNPVFTVHLRAGAHLSPEQATRLSQKLSLFSSGQQRATAQHKTAAVDKLLAVSYYDFTAPPGSELTDSIRLFYDSSRGSAFDYYDLSYDLDNNADFPINKNGVMPAYGYVNYDTMRSYAPGGPSFNDVGIRTYNVFNKVNTLAHPNNTDITYFEYDPFGKLLKTTLLQNTGGGLDSSYRDFFSYNPVTGFLEKDSSETWNGSTWDVETVIRITNNVSGFPLQETAYFLSQFGNQPFASLNLMYNAFNQEISATLSEANNIAGTLTRFSKDTFDYMTGMIVSHDTYLWDTTANSWVISQLERRHLNSSALVDSLFIRYYDNAGTAQDSAIQKLVYNNNDHPTFQRDFAGNGGSKKAETRYYYAVPIPTGVGPIAKDIRVYPNPASNTLYVNGFGGGRFSIMNAAGQLMIQGTLTQNTHIPLAGLPAGLYQLVAQDPTGALHAASFVKE